MIDPGSSTDRILVGDVGPGPTLEELLEDEQEAKLDKERRQQTRELEQEEYEKREADFHHYQENLLEDKGKAALSAAAYKAWEDWEWYTLMNAPQPKHRRTVMAVTLGAQIGGHGGWLSRQMRVPVQGAGQPTRLQLDLHLEEEEYPDDVETVLLTESVPHVPPVGEQDADAGKKETRDPVPAEVKKLVDEVSTVPEDGTLSDIEFADYEKIYAQWVEGKLPDEAIRVLGGPHLLDLMQTQRLMDLEETQVAPPHMTPLGAMAEDMATTLEMPGEDVAYEDGEGGERDPGWQRDSNSGMDSHDEKETTEAE